MLFYKNKEIINILHENKPIQTIYHLSKIVWQAVRSCFGAGYWNNDKPWSNEEGWTN